MSAVRYASPYTGSGRNYGIYTSYSAYKAEAGSMAQAPVASMSSTSRSLGSCSSAPLTMAVVAVNGIRTSASEIRGGITTEDTGSHSAHGGSRRNTPWHPGEPGNPCPNCFDGDGDGICDICDHEMEGCECEDCHCPITDGWQVWLMMALLAAGYAVRRNRKITQQ